MSLSPEIPDEIVAIGSSHGYCTKDFEYADFDLVPAQDHHFSGRLFLLPLPDIDGSQ